MSIPLVVAVTVSLVTVAILIAVLVAFVRHVGVLISAAERFGEETRPHLEEIQKGSLEARRRMDTLKDEAEAVRSLGDRIRR